MPISLEGSELPETLRFLASERGEGIAREIADMGREWVQRAVREEDIELAWFGILLEYASLLDESRDEERGCS